MRKRAIPRRLPRPQPPDQAEREYFRQLRKYAEAYIRLMREGLADLVPSLRETAAGDLPDIRTDAVRLDVNIEKRLRGLFDWVTKRLGDEFPEAVMGKWARNMVGHVNQTSKKNMARVAEKVEVQAEPLMRDGELSPYFQNVVDENVGLIRSIPARERDTFKNKLVAAITADQPQDQIREMIQAHFDVTRNAARLIARDQVGKLNGRLNQYRQQQLGGRRYVWRGSQDARERADHKRLEGKVFSWDSPPIVDRATGRRGHPGDDFQCRCHAEMVLEDVVE